MDSQAVLKADVSTAAAYGWNADSATESLTVPLH